MSRKSKITISALLAAVSLTQTCAFASELSDWAVSDYQMANEAGLVSYSVVANNMSAGITREQFCELAVNLYRSLTDETLLEPQVSIFEDTDNMAVSQAYLYGIVSGTSATTFEPKKQVTRQEMAKMLVSTLNAAEVSFAMAPNDDYSVISQFDDAGDTSSWAVGSVTTMLNYDFMNGVTEDKLDPLGYATREQAIASVNRSYSQFKQEDVSLALPQITSIANGDERDLEDLAVSWTPVDGVHSYTVILKDGNGSFITSKTVNDATSVVIPQSELSTDSDYVVIVGGVMSNGVEVYSLPIDFSIKSADPVVADTGSKVQNANSEKAKAVLAEAEKYLGVMYRYGGTSPQTGFDCSGFCQYVFSNSVGISLHRVSRDQYAKDGVSVSKSELQPGDLVFFGSGGSVSHVGIYVGDGEMIHSPSTGKPVQFTSINSDYYTSRYIGAKRVL